MSSFRQNNVSKSSHISMLSLGDYLCLRSLNETMCVWKNVISTNLLYVRFLEDCTRLINF